MCLHLIHFCLSRLQPGRRQPELHADPDAPEEGQADVLLGPLPQLRHHQDVLPRHQVQQEQHRPAGQVVFQLQVCVSFKFKFVQSERDNWGLISIGPLKCLDSH